ncbi:MAG: hypothetical protein LUI13_08215 [Lachnospiraceae bacterium]|nr:hypothetical protein [Lachnospiraceae bacterium]
MSGIARSCESRMTNVVKSLSVKNIFITKIDAWFTAKVLDDEDGLKEFFAAFTSGDAETLEDCLNYHLGESVRIAFYG